MVFAVIAIAAVASLGPLIAILTDLIRLGPAEDLGPDPIRLTVEVARASSSDSDPQFDWYAVRFSIHNTARARELKPYSLNVVVRLPNALTADRAPANGHPFYPGETREEGPRGSDYALGSSELQVPAGEFRTNSDLNTTSGITLGWTAIGEVGLDRIPIFEQAVDFIVYRIGIPEGKNLEAEIRVTLSWGYFGALQAYPVDSRGVNASAPFT